MLAGACLAPPHLQQGITCLGCPTTPAAAARAPRPLRCGSPGSTQPTRRASSLPGGAGWRRPPLALCGTIKGTPAHRHGLCSQVPARSWLPASLQAGGPSSAVSQQPSFASALRASPDACPAACKATALRPRTTRRMSTPAVAPPVTQKSWRRSAQQRRQRRQRPRRGRLCRGSRPAGSRARRWRSTAAATLHGSRAARRRRLRRASRTAARRRRQTAARRRGRRLWRQRACSRATGPMRSKRTRIESLSTGVSAAGSFVGPPLFWFWIFLQT